MKKLSLHELNRLTPEEFKLIPKKSISLLADNIRSGHNIGSLFRIADSFALEAVYLGGFSVAPPHPEINKTAIGSTASVHWEKVSDITAFLMEKKKQNYKIVVIEQTTNAVPLQKFHVDKECPYIIVFGNEVSGVSDDIIQLADIAIEIPQFGTKHSLNVSVAAGIVAWHFVAAGL